MSSALLSGTWISWAETYCFLGGSLFLIQADEPCTVNIAGISSPLLVSCSPLESSWVCGNYSEKSGKPLSVGWQPTVPPFRVDHALPRTTGFFTDKVPMLSVELVRSIS